MTHISKLSALLATLFGTTLVPDHTAHINHLQPGLRQPIWADHECLWRTEDGTPVVYSMEQYHGYAIDEARDYAEQHDLIFAALPGGRPNTQLIIFWTTYEPSNLCEHRSRLDSATPRRHHATGDSCYTENPLEEPRR